VEKNPADTLQKFMAKAGFASRRKSETFIDHGLVRINGQVAHLGDRVNEGDQVDVKTNRGLVSLTDQASKKVYIKLNKPVGYTCTNRRFEGEQNVFDLVKSRERLFVCGRLDKDSQGLVLLTNDGDLDLKLTHPRYQHEKIYEVRVRQEIDQRMGEKIMSKMRSGVSIGQEDGIVSVKDIAQTSPTTFSINLVTGKKRQIRRMFIALKLTVASLKRLEMAGIKLGGLGSGRWEYCNQSELKMIQKILTGQSD